MTPPRPIKEVKAGRVEFKLDKNGNVSVPVGKVSFAPAALVENGTAVIEAVAKVAARHGQRQVHPLHYPGGNDVARCERGRFGVHEDGLTARETNIQTLYYLTDSRETRKSFHRREPAGPTCSSRLS